MTYCFVVPHYNHIAQFEAFLPRLLATALPCVVVDDGSDAEQFSRLEALLPAHNYHLLRHVTNRGKGAAFLSGCHHACQLGFSHVVQIDADGQHQPQDVTRFMQASKAAPNAILSGMPVFDSSVPKARLYGRKISLLWVALETLSFDIKDALCGFRVYPLDIVEHLTDHYHIGPRMEFDTDMLVKARWSDIAVKFLPTQVHYNEKGVSHFHYLRDNLRLIRLHVGLLVQTPWRQSLRALRWLNRARF